MGCGASLNLDAGLKRNFYLLSVFALLLLPVFAQSAFAWSSDYGAWQYRRAIAINGSTSEQADYQVLVNLTSSNFNFSRANSQGNDTRFTWFNTTSGLEQNVSFWIEYWKNASGTGNASLWVKIPRISNTTTETVYMYYGNPSATYNNSLGGNNTFIFLEDSEGYSNGTSTTAGGWSGSTGTYSSTRAYSGGLSINAGVSGSGSDTRTISNKPANWLFECRAYDDGGTNFEAYGMCRFSNSDIRWENNMCGSTYCYINNGGSRTDSGVARTAGWHLFRMALNDNKMTMWIDDTKIANNEASGDSINTTMLGNWDNVEGAWYDNILVGKYAFPEPNVLSVGAEETHPVLWLKTYSGGSKARSFFSPNETVVIKSKAEGIAKTITIIGPDGNAVINNLNMTNETALVNNVAVWNYSFNLTNQAGWYDVRISGNEQKKAFYVGSVWQNNWTDAQGNNFPFRIKVNLSEPNVIERFFEPIDMNLNFTYKAHPNSIRVALWNGSQLIEIPSGGYNFNYQDGYAVSGNVVFLATLNKSENATYYIYYSRSNASANYGTDLEAANNSGVYEIQNDNYRIVLDGAKGGVIRDAYNKRGSNENLAGYSPMQMSPEAMGGSQYLASNLATPSISIVNGSLFANYKTSGETGNMRFNLTYAYYSHAPYIILETNVSPLSGETWDYYYDQQFRLKDGYFSKATWRNSTGAFEYAVGSGNGADMTSLGDLSWIAAYNNASGNSIGTIFLANSQSQAVSINSEFYDDASYERYRRRQFSAGSASVSPSDYFYSKTAIILWNAFENYERLNETYYRLKNPVNSSIGASETYDTQSPANTSSGYTPQSPNDNQNVTCYSYWTDNVELDYAVIAINSSAHNNQSTVFIRANESWVNYTISAGSLEAGTVTCNITVYDTAKLANSTRMSFGVSDTTPPYFTSITNQPNTNLSLDPGVRINITANLTEYTNISSAILQYRNDSGAAWQNITMNNTWNGTYIHTYAANFTPGTEGTWQYRIYSNDTLGNSNYSGITDLSVFYEYIWQSSPAGFGSVSGKLASNISVGSLIVDNTADTPFSFKITSDWENKNQVFFNGTAEGDAGFIVNLNNGASATIPVNVTAKSIARSDSLTITIDALNATASPDANTTTATIVSYGSGPFLLVTITQFPSSVTQGDTGIALKAKVQNMGNETATNTWLAFQLPGGWTITSGTLNKSIGSLAPSGGTAYNEINVSISGSSPTGTQTIGALSRSSENTAGTDDSKSVSVSAKSTPPPPSTIIYSGGGTGGGGLTPGQKEKLFQTEEIYELVRGGEQNFTLKVGNPFDGDLENVSVDIAGYLAQYLRVEPKAVEKIPVGASFDFTIIIEAPNYFTKGVHNLDFIITGTINRLRAGGNSTSSAVARLKETRKITLIIHEVSRDDAAGYLAESSRMMDDMKNRGIDLNEVSLLFAQLNESFEEKNYEEVRGFYEGIKSKKEKIFSTLALMDEVNKKITQSEHNGVEVSGTSRLLMLAKVALQRADYDTALKRAEDAKVTYAMETAGKFNPFAYARNELPTVSIAMLAFMLFIWSASRGLRLTLINKKLGTLSGEEAILLGLVKEVQKECFDEGRLSMEEYMDSLLQYETRLGKIVQEQIELQTKRTHLLKIFGKEELRLLEERRRLVKLMEETQRLYIEGGKFETRLYKSRMDAYLGRLTEIEERLATIEAKKALGGGV